MLKKIILHVGAHKTGTSTIQDSLINNRVTLESYGIKYFTSEDSVDCKLWEFLKGKNSEGWLKVFSDNTFLETIISDEAISLYSKRELMAIKKTFESLGYNISVHYFLREPEKFKTSDCKQIIRSCSAGINTSFDNNASLRYLTFPKKLDVVFGLANTYIHKFEDAIEEGLFKYFIESCSSNKEIGSVVIETRSNSAVSDLSIMAYDALFNSKELPCDMMRAALNSLSGESSITFPISENESKLINEGLNYLQERNGESLFEAIDFSFNNKSTNINITDLFTPLLSAFNTYFKGFDCYVDLIKESATHYEKKNELEKAYQLYQLALIIRPNGPVIRNKLRLLSSRLGKEWSGTW